MASSLNRLTALALVAVVACSATVSAQTEIPLWPKGAPGSEGKAAAKEKVTKSSSGELRVSGIHNPTITPYLPPEGKGTGLAILVIPGGGHRMLAITHEGYNVAEWLRDRGIAAFVLKHRLAREPNSTYRIDVESLADTERAIRTIRSRAAEWKVDPSRVGALGFSAGGELVWLASSRGKAGDKGAADPVERESSRPDFAALIYPGRSGDIQPTAGAPPVFLAAAYDDRQDISEGLAEVYLRFKRASVPAELHIYSTGGHGFGLRPANKRPAGQWIARFEEWLAESGFLHRPSRLRRSRRLGQARPGGRLSRTEHMDEGWRTVFVAAGELQAQQVRAFLEASGISAAVRGEALRKTHGLTVDGLGAVEIIVPADDAEAARTLLDSADAGAFRLPDDASVDGEG